MLAMRTLCIKTLMLKIDLNCVTDKDLLHISIYD